MYRPILLLTRPRHAAEDFLSGLPPALRHAVDPVYAPLMRIVTTGPLPDLGKIAGLVFTSANGVRSYAELGGCSDLPAFAVGDATAKAARDAGMSVRSASGAAGDLVALVLRDRPAVPLLHLRGRHGRGDVARRLSEAGTETREAVLYEQEPQCLTSEARAALAGDRLVVVPLFSPRTAGILVEEGPFGAPLMVAALSPEVARAAAGLSPGRLEIAARPDARALGDAVENLVAGSQGA